MLFSIIIPAKNEEKNIPQCLEAITRLNMADNEYEVLVIDNGSTDSTVSIVRKFGFPVYVKPELSLSGLRNFGASLASGEIMVFLDADCIPDFNWLKCAALTLLDSEVGCTGSAPTARVDGTWVEMIWSSFRTRRTDKCYTAWINSSNFFVRRELFARVSGFNENVSTSEDVDICMRLNKICKILHDPAIKAIHLGEPKTMTEFLFKEIWRGKGALCGVISHGVSKSELPSLLLPVYNCILLISLTIALPVFNKSVITLLMCLYLIPAVIFTLWVINKTKKYTYTFGYFILFLIYVNARSVSLFIR